MTGFLDSFLHFILGFGILGIGILAILDSTFFFFLPFALDAVLIISISRNPHWMPLYALITIAGSVIGSLLTYFLMRRASEETLEKKIPKKKLRKVKRKIEKGGFVGLVIASLLPPPFPFTPFVIVAAVSDLSAKKTFASIITGRTIRYFLEGFLAIILGSQILRLIESRGFKLFMLGLFVLAIIGTVLSIFRWVRR
jgi:membrane protein YqaA with SNARE-associated domain